MEERIFTMQTEKQQGFVDKDIHTTIFPFKSVVKVTVGAGNNSTMIYVHLKDGTKVHVGDRGAGKQGDEFLALYKEWLNIPSE